MHKTAGKMIQCTSTGHPRWERTTDMLQQATIFLNAKILLWKSICLSGNYFL